MCRRIVSLCLAQTLVTATMAAEPARTHNVLLFVAEGLRGGMVNEQTAPTMAALLKRGVHFTNSHAIFPTLATPNAAAMATGHFAGDYLNEETVLRSAAQANVSTASIGRLGPSLIFD